MSFSMNVDLSSLDQMLDDLGDKAEAAARPASQAAAQVFYDEVKRNVERLGHKSGNLKRSIYQAFSANNSRPGLATYHVSWNAKIAPHGHLLEYGHLQRYAIGIGKGGKWFTFIRPEAKGKPKPKRNALQSVKDAYYVPRKGGPKQIPARPFVRPALAKSEAAIEAAKAVLFQHMGL